MIKKSLFALLLIFLTLTLIACELKPDGEFKIIDRKSYRNKIEYTLKLTKTNHYKYSKENFYYVSWVSGSGRTEREKITYDQKTGYYKATCFGLEYYKEFNPTFGVFFVYKKKGKDDDKQYRPFTIVDQDDKKWPQIDEKTQKEIPFKDKTDNKEYDTSLTKEINSVDEYLEIANKYNLRSYTGLVHDNYKLMTDLDFKGKKFVPLAISFAGLFNGNNKKIFNIEINKDNKGYKTDEYDYQVSLDNNKTKKKHFTSFGLFDEILPSAEVKDLILEDIKYSNEGISFRDYHETQASSANRFGLIARQVAKGAKISNITVNNIDLTYISTFPTPSSESDTNVGAGLLFGFNKGEISNININNVKARFINRANSANFFGLVSGKANNSIQNVTIRNSFIDVISDESSIINIDRISCQSNNYGYKATDLKNHFNKSYNIYTGLVVGHMDSSEASHLAYLYLANNKIYFNTKAESYLKKEEKDYYVSLHGIGMGFDFEKNDKDEYVKEDNKDDNKVYKVTNQSLKTVKYGDKVRVYFKKKMEFGKYMAGVYSDNNSYPVKSLTVNGKHYYEKDYKSDDKFEGYYFIEFEVKENIEVRLNYSESLGKRNGATIDKDAFKDNDKRTIIEDRTIKPTQNYYPYLTTFKGRYLEKATDYRAYYAVATYTFKYESGATNKERKEFTYITSAFLDEDGNFEFPIFGETLKKIEIFKRPERKYYFGLVAGYAKNLASVYAKDNVIDHVGNFENVLNNDKTNNLKTEQVNFGLYTASQESLIYNTISENNVILSNNNPEEEGKTLREFGYLNINELDNIFNDPTFNNYFKKEVTIIDGKPVSHQLTSIDFSFDSDKNKLLYKTYTPQNRELFFKAIGIE